MKFEVGDKVEAFGLEGVVSRVDINKAYPIKINYINCDGGDAFTYDGKLLEYHKEPSLKLISKKPAKKKYWLWDVKINFGTFKTSFYLDDNGFDSANRDNYKPEYLIKKHENEFIEIEVK